MDFKKYFLKDPKPFTTKREVHWKRVRICSMVFLAALIGALLAFPNSELIQNSFLERAEQGTLGKTKQQDEDPSQEAVRQLQESQASERFVHGSIDHLYRSSGGSSDISGPDRSTSMILNREGIDSRSELSTGVRISIRLTDKLSVSNQSMPIVGIVSSDVNSDNSLAIPSGSRVLGEASFNSETDRLMVTWRSIILPTGRERPFLAIGIGRDNQTGVDGRVRSDGFKNAVGQTVSRFIGAYASGTMKTGMMGANEGGHENGLRNAVAQTAIDQANELGESLQKEKKWIEIEGGRETSAILSEPFRFKDAGAVDGR